LVLAKKKNDIVIRLGPVFEDLLLGLDLDLERLHLLSLVSKFCSWVG